ncbi:hypothetical protein ABIB57_004426 [Devosia sp. UYZn731]
MSPVKTPPGQSDAVSDLVGRYQQVIERARSSNVSPDAVFEVLRMEASEWHEDTIAAAILLVQERFGKSDDGDL